MGHLTIEQLWKLRDKELSDVEKNAAENHIAQCIACKDQWEFISKMGEDIVEHPVPDLTPGFALKVTSRVRETETEKLFRKMPFRIFKLGMAFSILLLLISLIALIGDNAIVLEFGNFQIKGWPYYLLTMACLVVIYVADRLISIVRMRKM